MKVNRLLIIAAITVFVSPVMAQNAVTNTADHSMLTVGNQPKHHHHVAHHGTKHKAHHHHVAHHGKHHGHMHRVAHNEARMAAPVYQAQPAYQAQPTPMPQRAMPAPMYRETFIEGHPVREGSIVPRSLYNGYYWDNVWEGH